MSEFKHRLYYNPYGHYLFRNDKGDISISDHSGATPEQTDDGPLVVHDEAECVVQYSPKDGGILIRVEVDVLRKKEINFCTLIPRDFIALRSFMHKENKTLSILYSKEYLNLKNDVRLIG